MAGQRQPKSGPVPPDLLLQYLVVLAGTDPLVWRRIRVPATYSFWDLHVAIQDAMGWLDYHLHEFLAVDPHSATTMRIGIPDSEVPTDRSVCTDWHQFPLDFATGSPAPFLYTYDFGDSWEHAVIFEGFEQADNSVVRAVCVAGAGACPPEDAGGPHAYAELLVALADSTHPNHDEFVEWAGEAFDPTAFSPADVRFDDPAERFRIAFEDDAS